MYHRTEQLTLVLAPAEQRGGFLEVSVPANGPILRLGTRIDTKWGEGEVVGYRCPRGVICYVVQIEPREETCSS